MKVKIYISFTDSETVMNSKFAKGYDFYTDETGPIICFSCVTEIPCNLGLDGYDRIEFLGIDRSFILYQLCLSPPWAKIL